MFPYPTIPVDRKRVPFCVQGTKVGNGVLSLETAPSGWRILVTKAVLTIIVGGVGAITLSDDPGLINIIKTASSVTNNQFYYNSLSGLLMTATFGVSLGIGNGGTAHAIVEGYLVPA